MSFMLHPEIDSLNIQVMYKSNYDKVEFQFASNVVVGRNRSKLPCDDGSVQLT